MLLGFGGDVKVIDFGIAKSEISTVKTEAGMIKGKFVYMSPEQSLAKPLDKRSDVFAIGITLYEMLCGQNPFHKSNIVLTLEAIQRTEPSPPSELDPALAPFDPILAKALAKDRERRYADASEMQEDLRRIVLPRASERMTGFLTRLFRSPVEDGNRPPVDSDSLKITGSRNAPATPPSTSAASPGDSATSRTLLVSGPVRKDAGVRITTPRPSPRPPPPPPKKPAALDTAVAEQPPIAVQDRVVAAIEPAPVEAASASGGETTDRIRKPAAVAARRRRLSGRGLWVAFGGGVFASVLLLGALATWAVVDHSPVPKLRRTAFSATTLSRRGTLWVDARELAVTKDAGSVQVEDVRLDFSRSGSVLDLRVQGPPGSIVFVNGVSRGPSPLAGVKLAGQETMLEVRKPGEGPGRPLRLRYREE